MKRLTLALGLVTLAAVLAACSGAAAGSSSPAPSSGTPADVSISAKDLKFSQSQLSAKAGAAFTIDFDNQESAPHNVAIKDAAGALIFKGEIVTATKITYAVPALAAGTYDFLCEVHPDMKGQITAQ